MSERTIKQQRFEYELGKIPPQDLEVERAILGAILIDSSAMDKISVLLRDEVFYKEAHQRIYAAAYDLFTFSQPIDILTVTATLRKSGGLEIAGGIGYITELTLNISSSLNIEKHAKIIYEHYLKRSMIKAGSNLLNEAYRDSSDAFELLEKTSFELQQLGGNIHSSVETPYVDQVEDAYQRVLDAKKYGGVIGVPSAYEQVNALLYGYQPGKLYIFAGRPGMGKSVLMTNEATWQASRGVGQFIFSIEMPGNEQISRQFSIVSGINYEAIQTGNLTSVQHEGLVKAKNVLKKLPIFLFDMSKLTLMEMRSIMRKIMQKNPHIKKWMGWVDYLQLMTDASSSKPNVNRTQEVGIIANGLKQVAKDFDMPIGALGQLSRQVENRKDSIPVLSDLKESGDIEAAADSVIFLHRPEYYGITQDEAGITTKNLLHLIVAKNRGGKLEKASLKFYGSICSILEDETWKPTLAKDAF